MLSKMRRFCIFIAEISNNSLSFIIKFQNTIFFMFYDQENILTPYCYFYVYLPCSSSSPQMPKLQENVMTDSAQAENSHVNITDEEKLILTKEDFEKEGYTQTKRPWTKQEDKLLISLCQDQDARFEDIASKMEGRNSKMCYSRYRRLAYLTKIGWNKLEDQRLIKLVEKHGEDDWKTLASYFKGRTHKQLKEHYTNYLKPELIRSQWTLEEDLQLVRLINMHGKDWKKLESEFIGRSRSQIKNRYFGKICRMNKKKLETIMKAESQNKLSLFEI